MILRLEHMGRLHVVAKADIDRYKAEIEKLKNIIMLVNFWNTLTLCKVVFHKFSDLIIYLRLCFQNIDWEAYWE